MNTKIQEGKRKTAFLSSVNHDQIRLEAFELHTSIHKLTNKIIEDYFSTPIVKRRKKVV